MQVFIEVNFVAVLAGTALNMLLGIVWYNPRIFGGIWMKTLGIHLNDIKDAGFSMIPAYAAAGLSAGILSWGLAAAALRLAIHSFPAGMLMGVAVWFCFNLPSFIKIRFFEDRPFPLFLINSGYDLLSYALLGGLLAIWH
jgi:hypothetical protein